MSVIRIVAAVVLDERNHVLVVRKRGTTAFMQPGGKIEPGEESFEALVREVREELGAGVDESSARMLGRFTAAAANEPGYVVDADLFLVSLDGVPRAAAEIEEVMWVDPHSADGVELAPLTSQTVLALARDASADGRGAVRAHPEDLDGVADVGKPVQRSNFGSP